MNSSAASMTITGDLENSPPQIYLFALRWKGEPVTICVDGEGLNEQVGYYVQAFRSSPFHLVKWDPIKEIYVRIVHSGLEEMRLLLCLSKASSNPWNENFELEEDFPRTSLRGPPFQFLEIDFTSGSIETFFTGSAAKESSTISLEGPGLLGQPENGTNPVILDSDEVP
ncbi:hypothetical protein M422DRAFT_257872 [Sphaerobolus stellatus SS14]|uniref:Uncharacterized protein n=1 Tax=Sphaerobolus stellatus (strain SS14) TaxID=990650 RepID=A0A0C9VCM6_SPHS4|nr:hypothetical protein M422DRAFT_257872 [Sphaerobolus stellatus SS14]